MQVFLNSIAILNVLTCDEKILFYDTCFIHFRDYSVFLLWFIGFIISHPWYTLKWKYYLAYMSQRSKVNFWDTCHKLAIFIAVLRHICHDHLDNKIWRKYLAWGKSMGVYYRLGTIPFNILSLSRYFGYKEMIWMSVY